MQYTIQKGQRILMGVAVLLGGIFLVIVAINTIHFWKSTQIKQASAEQLLYISRFSGSLATSHLWLEEAISADNQKTLQLYRGSLKEATRAYWSIPQKNDGASAMLSQNMKTLLKYLQRYDEIANVRIKDPRNSGINSPLDQKFDANFNRMMDIAKNMSEIIYDRITEDQRQRQLIQKVTLISSMMVLLVVMMVLHLFVRRYQNLKEAEKNSMRALQDSEERLRASEDHLRQAQLVAHIGSWEIKGASQSLQWSDEVYRIFGLEKKTEPSYGQLMKAIHPEDLERVKQAWDKHIKEQADYNVMHRIIRPDHTIAHLHERCKSTYDEQGEIICSLGTVQDVTHLILAKQEARLLQAVFHASSDMIGIADVDCTLLYANQALRETLGLTEGQPLDGTSLSGCYVDDDLTMLEEHIIPMVIKQGTWRGEMKLQHQSCGEICVSQVIQAHSNDQKVVSHVSLIARDITEEKQQQQKQDHKQRLESLGVLAGGIAHDFNNLLTAIMGHASMACEAIEEERTQHLNAILKSSQSAADLCRQMLVYSGKGKFIIEPLNVSHIVADMGHFLTVSINKKIIIKYDLIDPAPMIRGDRTQIQQLVMNLIMNASEAIGKQTGVIDLRTGLWHIDTASLPSIYLNEPLAAGDYVYIEVSDTGCGMSQEVQEHLFEPFFTTKFTGRGLGMSAILGIIRGHHGCIQLSSTTGKGSVFKIFLPSTDDVPSEPTVIDTKTALCPSQQQGCILIVDDEPMIRQLAAMVITRMGFDVLKAVDGVDAVEIFTEKHDLIVAVLLDMTMPRMGGEETFVALRAIKENIPVILSSGYDEHTATARLVDLSLTGFIQKPYAIKQLQKIVAETVPPTHIKT